MTIQPRLMIADCVATFVSEGTQNVELILMDRAASAEFRCRFLESGKDYLGDIIRYAHRHSVAHIGKPGVSFDHRKVQRYSGDQYHLGDIITEVEAAQNFGYVEPYIDTVAARIAEAAIAKDADSVPVFTDRLRQLSLITHEQSAIYRNGIVDVVSNERLQEFSWGSRVLERNGATHPITLNIFEPEKDRLMPVGVGFYVPAQNGNYEFMTYVPLPKQACTQRRRISRWP